VTEAAHEAAARVRVKICGVTSAADAAACIDEGADAIGINLVAGTPRCVSIDDALAIRRSIEDRAEVAFVVANDPALRASLHRRLGEAGAWMQLHGDETPADVAELLPYAYKALRIGGPGDAALAATYPGQRILTDARAPGVLGGSGATFDWSLVAALARTRSLILAGGLTPDNVSAAIHSVHPFAVDVASGVEVPGAPRSKDRARVRAFIAAVRGAADVRAPPG